jgi:hypothetical protein
MLIFNSHQMSPRHYKIGITSTAKSNPTPATRAPATSLCGQRGHPMRTMTPAMKKNHYRALSVAIGFMCAFIGLYAAIHLVGPIIRAWLGAPAGFSQDYTTKEAWRQARAVQLLSLGLIFVLNGILFGVARSSKPVVRAIWTANPFSVGLAYWFFQVLFSSRVPGEYFGDMGLALLSLLSPLVLAPCMLLGTWIGNRVRTPNVGDAVTGS